MGESFQYLVIMGIIILSFIFILSFRKARIIIKLIPAFIVFFLELYVVIVELKSGSYASGILFFVILTIFFILLIMAVTINPMIGQPENTKPAKNKICPKCKTMYDTKNKICSRCDIELEYNFKDEN
jgi:hypothetical protein